MKKIAIIGGGIAGLSAGIFAQKNGFESTILEKNAVIGGECTGWDRQGYHIDGCIHWLVGTKEGTALNSLWKTLGALDGTAVFEPDLFLTFEYGEDTVSFFRDLEKLKSSWLELSPEDRDAIENFTRLLKQLHNMEVPVDKPTDLMNPIEKLKMMGSMKEAGMVMQKYSKISLKEYAANFRHPALREALAAFLPENYSAVALFFGLATFTKGDANVPFGGSRAFAFRMAERYRKLGGVIVAPCEVTGLKSSKNSVDSITCINGQSFDADYVIAACDAKVLFERLLEGNHNDPAFDMRFNNPDLYPLASQVQVSLGYEGIIGDLPRTIYMQTRPILFGSTEIDRFKLTHFGHEQGYAPQGHTALHAVVNQFSNDYEAWTVLARDKAAYRKEKERIGAEVIAAVENRFPDMAGKLTVIDVATPKTYERYCNAYRGAFMPFMMTTRGKMLAHNGRIKGLSNIYLSGQWLQPPGGLPTAAITGKDTIMRICKQEKMTFTER